VAAVEEFLGAVAGVEGFFVFGDYAEAILEGGVFDGLGDFFVEEGGG